MTPAARSYDSRADGHRKSAHDLRGSGVRDTINVVGGAGRRDFALRMEVVDSSYGRAGSAVQASTSPPRGSHLQTDCKRPAWYKPSGGITGRHRGPPEGARQRPVWPGPTPAVTRLGKLITQRSRVQIPSPQRDEAAGQCEGSAPLSHIGSGTCVSPRDPAPAPGRHWLRDLCPTRSMSWSVLVLTWARSSQGGSRDAHGAIGG